MPLYVSMAFCPNSVARPFGIQFSTTLIGAFFCSTPNMVGNFVFYFVDQIAYSLSSCYIAVAGICFFNLYFGNFR